MGLLVASAWLLAVLAGMVGWGAALERLAGAGRSDCGRRAGYGMAVAVSVGGVLNLLALISPAAIALFVGCGVGIWLTDAMARRGEPRGAGLLAACRADPLVAAGALVVLGVFTLRWLAGLHTNDFNVHDDYHGYLVFPAKMIQAGTLGDDPFSERRIVSSLGGQYFLQAMVLAVLGFENVPAVEQCLGLAVLVGQLPGLVRLGVPARAVVLIMLAAVLVPAPQVNITSTTTAAALLLTLLLTAADGLAGRAGFRPTWLPAAVVAAGACTLKSTVIPACGIAMAAFLLASLATHSRREVAGAAMRSGLLVGALLLPWMLSMYSSSGTLLYPILGRGYHGTAYGAVESAADAFGSGALLRAAGRSLANPGLVVLLAGLVCLAARREGAWRPIVPAAACAGLGLFLLALTLPGSYGRFAWPFVFAADLAVIAAVARGRCGVMASAVLTAALVATQWPRVQEMLFSAPERIRIGLAGVRIAEEEEIAAVRRLQEAVRFRYTLLARIDKPFLLDFARPTVVVADYPGSAGPPPGMPPAGQPEVLAEYLQAHGVRYVAYSYRTEAGFPRSVFADRLRPDGDPWTRSQAANTFVFQDNLVELGRTRRRVFDDGSTFVIDLREK